MQSDDLKRHLQDELAYRCKKNPKYSLRAFARMLEVEPSFLSKILRGERKLTPKKAKQFCERLGVAPPQVLDGAQYLVLDQDRLELISDGIHYSILELFNVKTFRSSPEWIAKALGVQVHEVRSALDRLIRLQMIERDPNGVFKNTSGSNTTIGSTLSVGALRKLQTQHLEQAIRALEEIPIESRDQGGITFSIPISMLPLAREKIKSFRRELVQLCQNTKHPHDEVYQFTTSLFPVSQINKGRSS